MSSQIWCQKIFLLLMGGGFPAKKRVAQNDVNTFWFLEFLRSDDFGGGWPIKKLTDNQPNRHTNKPMNTIVTR